MKIKDQLNIDIFLLFPTLKQLSYEFELFTGLITVRNKDDLDSGIMPKKSMIRFIPLSKSTLFRTV